MQQLKGNPKLSHRISLKGLDEKKIQDIRNQFNEGKEFPKALEEYFLIGGESEATGMVYEYNDFEELREDCEESLENCGYTMNRPYFVFDRLDSIYSIFF